MNHRTKIMFCTHITEQSAIPMKNQYPDLLCSLCCESMANEELPKDVHLACRDCLLEKLRMRLV